MPERPPAEPWDGGIHLGVIKVCTNEFSTELRSYSSDK